jgi:single-stranded-DNA-specific exonuclease
MQIKLLNHIISADVDNIKNLLKIDPTLAMILVQRGITTYDDAKLYFAPNEESFCDPLLMLDLPKAKDRLYHAIINKEKILVYGDYDVDGTTSVALMSIFLKTYDANFEYYIPDRYKEGYGLSNLGIEYAHDNNFTVLITLDCGIKSYDKAEKITSYGIDWIICDHHQPDEEFLPKAYAVCDPKRANCQYPFKELTGCGVGFKLIQSMYQDLNEKLNKSFDPMSVIDLLALSTACDIVPIVGENRTLVYLGIKKLRENPLPGVKSIMNLATNDRTWNITDILFFIGPRINAAGRIRHAHYAVDVMLLPEVQKLDDELNLEQVNTERKEVEAKILESAISIYDESCSGIVLSDKDWHKGVIGIVASKLVERYYKPVILLTQSNGYWAASGRSVHDFDLYEALDKCSEHLLQFGGHKFAAGLTLEDSKLEDFKNAFNKYCKDNIREDQKTPILEIDASLEFSQLNDKFVRILDRMEPFGPMNLKPKFITYDVELVSYKILNEKHLKCVFSKNDIEFDAIMFSAEKYFSIINKKQFDIIYSPEFNTFRGNTKIQLMLKHII